jgi:hypothetical protein
MAIITTIDATKSISLAPAIINNNFTNIANELADIANLLAVSNSSLALNKKIAAPTNGIEASAIILTEISGLLINAMPNGVATVFSVSNLGEIVGLKLTLDQAQTSTIGGFTAFLLSTHKENLVLEKALDLRTGSAVVLHKHNVVQITSANVGSGASNPIDISDKNEILFDAYNGGSQLVAPASDATINIETSTLIKGQIITFRLFRKNGTNTLKLLNGDNTAPLFTKIDYVTGYLDIAYTVFPEFDDTASGYSWIKCQWVEVTPAVFRFVILESSNVNNV